MKYQILEREAYPVRDRNKPKVNPFPSFKKLAELAKVKLQRQKQSKHKSSCSQDQTEDSSTFTLQDENNLQNKTLNSHLQLEQLNLLAKEYESVPLEIQENYKEPVLSLFDRVIKETEQGFDFLFY